MEVIFFPFEPTGVEESHILSLFVVERKTMERYPSTNCHSNRGNLSRSTETPRFKGSLLPSNPKPPMTRRTTLPVGDVSDNPITRPFRSGWIDDHLARTMVSDIPSPLHMEDGDPHFFEDLRSHGQVFTVSTSPQGDHMGMFTSINKSGRPSSTRLDQRWCWRSQASHNR